MSVIRLKALILLVALAVAYTAAFAGSAQASWRFDTERFLRSYHGGLSCVACHKDVVNAEIHPNPATVNNKLTDFFAADECFACHANVKVAMEAGYHGRLKVQSTGQYMDCLTCHHPHYDGAFNKGAKAKKPALAAEDEACMTCHQSPTGDAAKDRERNRELCFHCHMVDNPAGWSEGPLIDPVAYSKTPHATYDCMVCHVDGAKYPHNQQSYGECTDCHARHDESVAHDAHMTVACESCHLSGVEPIKDEDTQLLLWDATTPKGDVTPVHQMLGVEEEGCNRCHVKGNTLGASDWALPAKSVICIGCHASTISAGDTISVVTIIIFLAGIGLFFAAAFGAAGGGAGIKLSNIGVVLGDFVNGFFAAITSRKKLARMGNTILYDVLLQRRLWQRSQKRWFIHSLMFLPFAFRFVWGLVGLVLSNWAPSWDITWYFVNKNAPGTAFLFDLSGILIFIGLVLAIVRGQKAKKDAIEGLPKQDLLALGLIAGTVFVGHILEAMRIAMTGAPDGSEWAFLGMALSHLFSAGSPLQSAYGYVWYLHALFTGAFIAYLPFSRLMHIIMAPVILTMNAAQDEHH